MLFEQRHQKVNGQVNVLDQLIFIHANVSNSNAQAQDLKWKVKWYVKSYLIYYMLMHSLQNLVKSFIIVWVIEDGIWTTWFKHRRHRPKYYIPLDRFTTRHYQFLPCQDERCSFCKFRNQLIKFEFCQKFRSISLNDLIIQHLTRL